MTLNGFLQVLEGLFVGVAPRVAALQRWAIGMVDVLVRRDYDTKKIRLRGWFLRRCLFHISMIHERGMADQ